jgi:uncharacterized membrane protein YhaH (DUF805 family)
MDLRFLFLEGSGRLAPRPFARGLVLLTAAMVAIITLSVTVATQLSVFQFALVVPYLFLFGKRLHDAGLSAWLWLVFAFGWLIVNGIIAGILMPVLSPAAAEMRDGWVAAIEGGSLQDTLEDIQQDAPAFERLSAVTTLVAFLVSSAIIGFIAYSLRSDPNGNTHGPPTLQDAAG